MSVIYSRNKKLLEAACWFANYLKIADSDFTLKVIARRKLSDDFRAYCTFDSELKYAEVYIKCKKKKPSRKEYESLAHEMIHVKQYVLGELQDDNEHIWKGQVYNYDEDSDEDYWNAPWEVEAYGREKGLNYLRMKAKYEEDK